MEVVTRIDERIKPETRTIFGSVKTHETAWLYVYFKVEFDSSERETIRKYPELCFQTILTWSIRGFKDPKERWPEKDYSYVSLDDLREGEWYTITCDLISRIGLPETANVAEKSVESILTYFNRLKSRINYLASDHGPPIQSIKSTKL